MKRMIPDTNVFLRFLVGDVATQHSEAVKIFKRGEMGRIQIVVIPFVIAETCFVLNKFYKQTYLEIAEAMESLLAPNWLEIEHKEALRGMWQNYREGMHFVDSFLLSMKKYENCELFSFDKKLLKRA
jgi:predicted nucleic-acid-binding protein